ncbi:aminotransferase class V-fold PLP-dependent enzyme [Paralimibaculum aggregatum]|uniref:Aminotransferase class V-fold PLP-dependent enzyme n=2 Tax=Paralimibaculum aggregatum TaxID=3036245 RepID=A0ABQ6LSZ0_9RHOB|nr:aminotransferase class V-fold PLP-dependent enzyme [Limibaculum sp. NKW23]
MTHATIPFREGFPALRNQTYLSICDKMILHRQVRAEVETFLDALADASASRTQHETRVTACRERFAALVGARPEEIAVGRNVSDGINATIWAVDWREGDNVVLSLDLEHPNNAYPWLRLRERGVELRSIPARDGRLDYAALIGAMDDRTRVLTCASVSFAPGFRADLERLGQAAHRRDALLVVDGVQTAGILQHDLHAENVDVFVTSTSKGLLGLYGFGFQFVSARCLDRLRPAYLSRPAVASDNEDHSAMGSEAYRLQPDARRFEVGSYNLAGAYAADAAMALLAQLGAETVEARALDVAARLRTGMVELGLPDVAMPGPAEVSHLVTAGPLDAGGHGYSDTRWVTDLSAALAEARIAHTVRRGQLRFGTHAYNIDEDADRALDVMQTVRRAA